jgi:hypothetical protein
MSGSSPKASTRQTDIAAYFRDQAACCLAIAHARQSEPEHASFLRIAQHWQTVADASDLYERDTADHQEFGSFELKLT